MKTTNAIEKALQQKISQELRDIVDRFTNEVTKMSDKYGGGSMWYYFRKTNNLQSKTQFEVQGIKMVNSVLHSMLMEYHGSRMLEYKSKELLDKLNLEL